MGDLKPEIWAKPFLYPPSISRFNERPFLVGGFNPSEKYSSKWESSPTTGENKKYLKPPPSFVCGLGAVLSKARKGFLPDRQFSPNSGLAQF